MECFYKVMPQCLLFATRMDGMSFLRVKTVEIYCHFSAFFLALTMGFDGAINTIPEKYRGKG
jgi:hypothetical protein